jgi:hypothetical protein
MKVGIRIASLIIGLICGLTGCASSDTRMGTDSDLVYQGNADAASFGSDHFTFRKSQKIRPPNDFKFYFKNCIQDDDRSYYSKTSYWCDDL